MKKYIFALSLASLFLFNTSSALADDEVRNLVVDLKGKGFTQSTWMDNLDSNNIIFAAKDKFQLQLKVSNLGNRSQTNIVVKEIVPGIATTDAGSFTIPQIAAGQDFVKNITVTVKDKPFIPSQLTSSTIRYNVTSNVDTQAADFLTFFTNGGTKSAATVATQSGLPKTGAASNILLGSGIALGVGLAAFALRKAARGY